MVYLSILVCKARSLFHTIKNSFHEHVNHYPALQTSQNHVFQRHLASITVQDPKNTTMENDAVEQTVTTESIGKRKESPETGATKKHLNPRSPAWDHFTRMKENHNKCVCNYCHKVFGCKIASVNEMLVLGELPLVFIESVAWKHFCNKVRVTWLSLRITLIHFGG